MNAEVITIGDEILIGQVTDTNSAWLAAKLNEAGFQVSRMSSVGDRHKAIADALDQASQRAEVVILTGGLGPTRDDITKKALCAYFNTGLVFDARAFSQIETIFRNRGREILEINRRQAELPENCTPLYNGNGTAPGMWFEEGGIVCISLPGVPFEMKALMHEQVIPRLREKFNPPAVHHRTILTAGAGESYLAGLISKWEDALPAHVRLAYLPSPGMVRLRLSASGDDKGIGAELDELVRTLRAVIGRYLFGYGEDTLAAAVGRLLRERKLTVATAESCTGGYLSHLITCVPGSSDYFMGSVIAYDNMVKRSVLDVPTEHFDTVGAVSEPVVTAMAVNVRKKFPADFAMATSGIAGPDGATPGKPVGYIWVAVAGPEHVYTKLLHLGKHRLYNIEASSMFVLNKLRLELLGA